MEQMRSTICKKKKKVSRKLDPWWKPRGTPQKFGLNGDQRFPLSSASVVRPTPIAQSGARTDEEKQCPRSPLPSKTLKRRRPRHSGFLEPGSVPRVHRVGPVHVPRLEVPLGVRKASLSYAVVLAHDQSVVERRQCCLVLLPPQMFGRLRTRGSAAGDQGHRPHLAADGLHPSLASSKSL